MTLNSPGRMVWSISSEWPSMEPVHFIVWVGILLQVFLEGFVFLCYAFGEVGFVLG